MTILVFGRTGQLAQELQRQMPQALFLGRESADLSAPEICAAAIHHHRPTAVINAAAWTGVDKAETEEAAANVVNAQAPGAMARACAALDIPFLHVSTDYVFNGMGEFAFSPDDKTGPLGAYGRSKLKGEEAIQAAGGKHFILRTSWVVSAHGHNFVKTMLRLGREREALSVVCDQIGGPTPAADIAAALLVVADAMINGQRGGTYHFSGAPDCSWADFAREIMIQADLNCQINDIPTSAYPTPAQRPANSRLDCRGLEKDFAIQRPDWREGLKSILKELSA